MREPKYYKYYLAKSKSTRYGKIQNFTKMEYYDDCLWHPIFSLHMRLYDGEIPSYAIPVSRLEILVALGAEAAK